jgi:hypothetical protein
MALNVDADFLAAALAGYQQSLVGIETRIAELRKRIGGVAPVAAAPAVAPAKKKRRLSAEGRARIVAATKKRWAAVRKAKAEAAAAASKPAKKRAKVAPKKAAVKRPLARKAKAAPPVTEPAAAGAPQPEE